MESKEKITGEKIEETLQYLKNNQSFIQVRFPSTDDGELTVISDITSFKNISYLVIEKPRHMEHTAAAEKPGGIEFQFMGKDNLLYTFVSTDCEIFIKEMWIRFPDEILRHQRRNHFRLDVPDGTRLSFDRNRIPVKMVVSNISLGGSLGALIFFRKTDNADIVLRNGDTIENIDLSVPAVQDSRPIRIKKARIIRRDKNVSSGEVKYAIEFLIMEREEKKILTTAIYDIQRQYLRNRLRLQN